jgi:hypothetical protein
MMTTAQERDFALQEIAVHERCPMYSLPDTSIVWANMVLRSSFPRVLKGNQYDSWQAFLVKSGF